MQDERGYRVRKDIREAVVFAPQNIVMDPPFTKLDVLSCRNLLIYLSPELQKKLIPLFHYALNPGGILLLGSAETVGASSALFAPADGKTRVFRRLESKMGVPAVEFPRALVGPTAHVREKEVEPGVTPPPNLSLLVDRLILQRLVPAAILTNDKGDILYISGRTGKYLEPATGKANLNVFAMAREGMRFELSSAFATALREDRAVVVRAPKVQTNGSTQAVEVTVQKIAEPKELRGTVLISIEDVSAVAEKTKPTAVTARVEDLQRELQHAREEVQKTREEMQTSQEELKSTNEELQSANEELQSTNEELTTSKEEMQSMNEELQTVNHELQSKVDELSRSNNDMKNLLNSTDIATLFLDGDLKVRRFTTPTARIIKLIPGDTGRPITDIASDLDYPQLAEDAREVLRTLVFKEKEVAARDGRWFSVRILPYRTVQNVIDGVVITFTEVTASKTLEVALREHADQLRQMTEALPNLVWSCRADGACESLGRRWIDYTGVAEAEQLGYGWLEQVHSDERESVRQAWRAAVRSSEQLDIEFRLRRKDGAYRWFKTGAAPIRDARGALLRWACTSTDVDDLKRAADDRARAAERMASILEAIDDAFISLDEQLRITYFNAAAERAAGRKRETVLGKDFAEAFPKAGAAVEEQIRAAMREKHTVSFKGVLMRAAPSPLRVFPHPPGVSIFVTAP